MKRKPQKTIRYNREWTPDGTRERYRWVENASRGLRIVGPVHELRYLVGRWGHTGWHLDPLGEGETVHGVVLQLPGRGGFARFVPAISDPYNADCYVVDFTDHYDAPGDDTDDAVRDCAHTADYMAELHAERGREYQAKETAHIMIEDERERIRTERNEAHALAAEMRECAYILPDRDTGSAICKELHHAMTAHRAAVRSAIKRIRTLTDNPYAWLEGRL